MSANRRNFLAALAGASALPALSSLAGAGSLDAHLLDTPSQDKSAAALAADPLRPQYHLLPAANWMNDANGPIYWSGNYHMFYQYNPNGAFWGDMHWAHAVSADMVHWKHLPVALAPTPGGPDAEGCFTGTAVVQDGRVAILYTGVRASSLEQATIKDASPQPLRETQCLAFATDAELTNWSKVAAPVLAAAPPGLEVNGFRDPSPWRQGDWWHMVTACGLANQGGAVLLYRSKDLRSWEYMHILAQREREGADKFAPFDPWEVWECPEFFPLGDRHVLIYSTSGKTWWQSGKLDAGTMTFRAERSGLVDYGAFYAAKTQLDKSGNRIIWGWITETRAAEAYKAAGWAGMMALPRILSLGDDGSLRSEVAPEVKRLRDREQRLEISSDENKNRLQIDGLRLAGCCGEILCTARKSAEAVELTIFGAELGSGSNFDAGSASNAGPWLTLRYDPSHPNQVLIDGRPIQLTLKENENLELHLYADGSVIETLVNRQIAMTKRFYYAGKAQDLRMAWVGKTTDLVSLSVWQLSPISPNRLTT